MNERKLHQLNILTLIAVAAGLICVGIFVFVLAPADRNKIGGSGLDTYNDPCQQH